MATPKHWLPPFMQENLRSTGKRRSTTSSGPTAPAAA